MSNIQDQKEQKLEAMLQARRFESASPDLAERIVHKAERMPQKQTIFLTQWVKGLFAEFHLPRPVYVLACTLIVGAVVGFHAPLHTNTADEVDPVSVQSFLYASEYPL